MSQAGGAVMLGALFTCVLVPLPAFGAEPSRQGAELGAVVTLITGSLYRPVDAAAVDRDALESIQLASSRPEEIFADCVGSASLPKRLKRAKNDFARAFACSGSTDASVIEKKAIKFLMAKYDPWGSYIDADQLNSWKARTPNEDGGFGVWATSDGEGLRINKLHSKSSLSGMVSPGDRILTVDGVSLSGKPVDDAMKFLRGPAGSSASFTVQRGDGAPSVVKAARLRLGPEQTEWSVRDRIVIVRIGALSKSSSADVARSIDAARSSGAKAIVLDLRANEGGLFDQALAIADLFLDEVPIVSVRGDGPKNVEHFRAVKGDIASGMPMVILIDNATAAGAEIIAAALQDGGRAEVIGAQSFKNGSIQTLIRLSEQSALKLTTSHVVRLNGMTLSETGVIPSSVLPSIESAGPDDRWLDQAISLAQDMLTAAPAAK